MTPDTEEPGTDQSEKAADGRQELSQHELERLHARVWAEEADYVHIDLKRTTAERMVGWLHEFASHCDDEGFTTTSDHARSVAELLRREVSDT